MSEHPDHSDEEVLDGEPVTDMAVEPIRTVGSLDRPTRRAAALAATSFMAGVATVAVIGRRGGLRRRRRRRRRGLGEVVSSSSFLVDVHVLKR